MLFWKGDDESVCGPDLQFSTRADSFDAGVVESCARGASARGNGQRHGQPRTAAVGVDGRHAAVVGDDDLLHEREAQARSRGPSS